MNDNDKYLLVKIIVLANPDSPFFENTIDPHLLASKKPAGLDLHCFAPWLWMYAKNPNLASWLDENCGVV